MCSDVFIFENSVEYESYVLAILCDDDLSQPPQEDSSLYYSFTLDVFSFIELDLKELPYKPIDKSYDINGMWGLNGEGRGGSLLSHRFVNNPQYRIHVPETA